jgi:hypothetical protein
MTNDTVANILRDLIADVSASIPLKAPSPAPSEITIKAENEYHAEKELNRIVNDLDNRYRMLSQEGKFNGQFNLAESKLPNSVTIGGKHYELTGVKKHILKTIEQEIIGKRTRKI